jgi:deoxyribodipyrimidine photolyase-related protein
MSFFIFPHQLFNNLDYLNKDDKIYLIEEPRFFTDFNFHKLKLAYHRASMKKYYDFLKKKKYNVTYIEFDYVTNDFYKSIKNNVSIIFVNDFKLENKLTKIYGKKLVILENKNFLIKLDELNEIKKLIFKNKKYSHEEFYKYQRRKLDILIDSNNKPINGKWSFDNENRLPLPKNHIVVKTVNKVKKNKYIDEAIKYVNKHFKDNYGSLDNFIYPIDHLSSKKWLLKFLKERLINFGAYEDAVDEKEPFVYHAVISPMMNIGLITDTEVVDISYKYYLKNTKHISIQSFEGFIRQMIGWRNYVYTIYLLEGPTLYETNQLKHYNKINDKFWTGETGMIPIDSIIQKIVKYSYAHHIERLMYLGNFMLLCFIDPKQVYKIFMEWTIDAYDWVMIPNVFGMSQYSSSMMMTRPYFSSSNYINKMSTFKRSSNDGWSDIWDALYYNFINKHQELFKKNYAIALQVKNWNNKTDSEQKIIIKKANEFIDNL